MGVISTQTDRTKITAVMRSQSQAYGRVGSWDGKHRSVGNRDVTANIGPPEERQNSAAWRRRRDDHRTRRRP